MDRLRRLAPFLIWPVLGVFVLHYLAHVRDGDATETYRIGDWLINYSGGFVRRGLVGSILYQASKLDLSLKWLIVATQLALYCFIFAVTQRIYSMRDRGREWLLLLFSPAFLFFYLYDPWGGFRKELIVFAAFLVLAHAYAKRVLSPTSIFVSLGLFTLAAFSHELTGFTLPFFALVLYRSFRSGLIGRRLAQVSVLMFSTVALSSLALSRLFAGGTDVAKQICDSAVSKGFDPEVCKGAIRWLAISAHDGYLRVVEILPKYVPLYPLLAVVALLPLLTSNWLKKNKAIAVVGLGFMTPLFLVALDWGRWLHIYFFFLFILMLAESVWQNVTIRRWPLWAIAVYLSVWSIPHFGGTDQEFLGLAQRAIEVIRSIWPT